MLLATVWLLGCQIRPSPQQIMRDYLRRPIGPFELTFSLGEQPVPVTMEELLAAREGVIQGQHVSLCYPAGRRTQAAGLAALLDAALAFTEQELDLRLGLHLQLWLHPVADVYDGLSFATTSRPGLIDLPLPTSLPATAPAGEVAAEVGFLIYLAVHELVELQLLAPEYPPTVLPDIRYGALDVVAFTRWFRDGFANYAAYLVVGWLADEVQVQLDAVAPRFWLPHELPHTQLAARGAEIFPWTQFDEAADVSELYEAVLGLMLLVERTAGRGALARVVRALPTLELPDGEALIGLFKRELGLDLRALAANFRLPSTGMQWAAEELQRCPQLTSVETGSAAARAGLRVGDVVIEAGGAPLRSPLDLELALLTAATRLPLVVRRADLQLELTLPLRAAEAGD